MREHPAVKIRRELALVIHIAARAVIAFGLDGWDFDDLVVSEHILGVLSSVHTGLAGYLRLGAVGPDDGARTHLRRYAISAL